VAPTRRRRAPSTRCRRSCECTFHDIDRRVVVIRRGLSTRPYGECDPRDRLASAAGFAMRDAPAACCRDA
jgi:hypothetical protein